MGRPSAVRSAAKSSTLPRAMAKSLIGGVRLDVPLAARRKIWRTP